MRFFEIVRDIGWLVILVLFVSQFLKEDNIYRTFVSYLFLNALYKCVDFFFPNVFFLDYLFLLIQQVVLGLFYYQVFVTKKQKNTALILIIFSIIIMLYSAFAQPITEISNRYNILMVVIVVSILGFIHYFNQLKGNRIFFYFNIGILIFFIGTVFSLVVILIIYFIFRLPPVLDCIPIVMYLFELVLLGLLVKEWLEKKNSVTKEE